MKITIRHFRMDEACPFRDILHRIDSPLFKSPGLFIIYKYPIFRVGRTCPYINLEVYPYLEAGYNVDFGRLRSTPISKQAIM